MGLNLSGFDRDDQKLGGVEDLRLAPRRSRQSKSLSNQSRKPRRKPSDHKIQKKKTENRAQQSIWQQHQNPEK